MPKKKNCLVLVSGIGEQAYCLKSLRETDFYAKIEDLYDGIEEVDYQQFLDEKVRVGRVILDPWRLLFTRNGRQAQDYLEEKIKSLVEQYDNVDCLSHSQGSQMILRAPVKFRKLILVASPLGFGTILARMAVRWWVGLPKVKCDTLYYIFSVFDPVSMFAPNLITEVKYQLSASRVFPLNTMTGHHLKRYLEWIEDHAFWIFGENT